MKKLNLLLAYSAILLFSGNLFSQTTLYVATNGSNTTGNGSLGSPYQTPQYAIDNCSEGDTIELRGGTYNITSELRIEINDITIRSYPGEWAIIYAPHNNEEDLSLAVYYADPDVNGGTLERLEIVGGFYYALKFESNWDWGQPDRHGVRNIQIKNCRIHDSGRDCIKITPGCGNILIENCEIFNSGMNCTPGDCNADGIDCVNGNNIVIHNCYVHNTGTNGVYLKGGARDGIIESNLFMNCGTGGILLGFKDTDAEWFDPETNPDYYENINGTIKNNIVIGTQDEGIGLYATLNAKVYNNTIIDAAPRYHGALYISRGENWISNEIGMIYPPNKDVDVRNNIFMNLASADNPVAGLRYEEDDPGSNMLGNCTIDYNIYYQQGGAVFDDDLNGGSLTFELWKNNTGFDEHSKVQNPILDNNYHLTSSSTVAIDKGITINGISNDYDGDTRSGALDIGADEYSAGTALDVPPASGVLGTGNGSEIIFVPVNSIFNTIINNDNSILVYPNPTNGNLWVLFRGDKVYKIELNDNLGSLIETHTLTDNQKIYKLDLSGFKNGLYSIKFTSLNSCNTAFIIKK